MNVEQTPKSVVKERLVAALLATLGICAAILSWAHTETKAAPFQEHLLVLFFTGAIILSDHYPIHLLRGIKVSLTNLPIFLSESLLSAPLVKEYEIPWGARVIAMADSFDAMTSDHLYCKAMSGEEAIQILLSVHRAQRHPNIANAFVDMRVKSVEEKPIERLSLQRISSILSQAVPISS